jgi:hypothetical protein
VVKVAVKEITGFTGIMECWYHRVSKCRYFKDSTSQFVTLALVGRDHVAGRQVQPQTKECGMLGL